MVNTLHLRTPKTHIRLKDEVAFGHKTKVTCGMFYALATSLVCNVGLEKDSANCKMRFEHETPLSTDDEEIACIHPGFLAKKRRDNKKPMFLVEDDVSLPCTRQDDDSDAIITNLL